MAEQKKKETRLMKVTMDADEFAKFDEGITHSDKGVRNDKGKLSALPDIAPINEKDLPTRTIVKKQPVYVRPKEPTLGQMLKQEAKYAIADTARDIINDPYVRAAAWRKAKQIWNDHIKPWFTSSNEESRYQTKAEQIMAQQQTDISYQIEMVNENHERILVTGEQAERLITAMRQKARELSSMIFLLSNIAVKDEKTDTDYIIEETYIKQLVSEEATSTIRTLMTHRQLLDEGTAICFDDWLNGYIRNGDQRIPIPFRIEQAEGEE